MVENIEKEIRKHQSKLLSKIKMNSKIFYKDWNELIECIYRWHTNDTVFADLNGELASFDLVDLVIDETKEKDYIIKK